MTRTAPPQVAFSSGEIDPLLAGRFDYARYQTGLKRCHGFLPLPQGGVTRAPGSMRMGQPREGNMAVLVPFQFAANDSVLLEFTPGWMRVWRYGQLVLASPGGTPYQLATPFAIDDLARLQWVQSADVIYFVDGRNPVQRLSRFALNSWTIQPQNFETGPFRVQNLDKAKNITASAETGVITLSSDFDIFTAGHVGSLMQLSPTDNTTVPLWTSNEDLRANLRNPLTGAALGTGTWTANDGPPAGTRVVRRYGKNLYQLLKGINAGVNPPIHDEGDALVDNQPTMWRYLSDDVGIVRITAVSGPRAATATVLRTVPIACVAAPTYRWSEGAWSARYGYPSSIEFFDQRLCLASTPSEPRTVWFSAIGDFADFLSSTEPDGAFAYAIAGTDTQNAITGLRRGRAGLHIFALSEEYSTRAQNQQQSIGPTNIKFNLDGSAGARNGRAIAPSADPIFVSRDGRRIIKISYNLQVDANGETNLTRASQHLGDYGFKKIVWQKTPEPRAWILLDTGELAVMIFDESEEILGWSTHSLAGAYIEDIAVTSNATGTVDEVWVSCIRVPPDMVFSPENFRHIERLDFSHHLCSALQVAQSTVAPLVSSVSAPWLAGREVIVSTLNEEYRATFDALGNLTLAAPARFVTVGLFDESHEFVTLDIIAAARDGNAMGRQKRLQAPLAMRLDSAAGGSFQVIEQHGPDRPAPVLLPEQDILPISVGSDRSQAFTGIVDLRAPSGLAKEVFVSVKPKGNAPLTVLGITPTVEEAGR